MHACITLQPHGWETQSFGQASKSEGVSLSWTKLGGPAAASGPLVMKIICLIRIINDIFHKHSID